VGVLSAPVFRPKKSVPDVRIREQVSLLSENLIKISSPFIKKLPSR